MTAAMRLVKRLRQRQDGAAFVEFAICLPVLLLLVLGAIEVTRYILIVQKVEKTTATIADVVGQEQAPTVHAADLDNIVTAAAQVMQPYDFPPNGYVIISSVSQIGAPAAGNPPTVNWQYTGGGQMVETSQVGGSGGGATVPASLALSDGDNVIVVEVFYNYQPLFAPNSFFANGGNIVYRMDLFKPRLGALTKLSSLSLPGSWRILL